MIRLEQRIVEVDAGLAVEPQASAALEVDEEQADLGLRPHVPDGQEHAVAVVDGKAMVGSSTTRTKPGGPPCRSTAGTRRRPRTR